MTTPSRILLGHTYDGDDALADPERLVRARLLVQANSGGGKSRGLRLLLEQTHAYVPQIVIDVEDEFHTLREKYDYILAGKGGDCPATPKTAPLLARRLLELGVSAIISIGELKKDERFRFVKLFLDALIGAPRELWREIVVVIDEAHLFCPQSDAAESADAVVDLMTRGRKRGYSGWLATQRISKIHKDAVAEVTCKLIGRCGLDVDQKRAGQELGFTTREQFNSLRNLSPGSFWAFGPAFADGVNLIHLGDVKTTHTEAGRRAPPVPPPPDKVRAILSQLADLPAEVEAEAATVASLRRDVATLERHLAFARSGAPSDKIVTASYDAGYEHGWRAGARAEQKASGDSIKAEVRRSIEGALSALDRASPAPPVEPPAPGRQPGGRCIPIDVYNPEVRVGPLEVLGSVGIGDARAAPPARVLPSMEAFATEQLGALRAATPAPTPRNAAQRVIDAIAWLQALGITWPNRSAVAMVAGYSSTSSGFEKIMGALRREALISYPNSDTVCLSDRGKGAANRPDVPPTGPLLRSTVLGRVARAHARILGKLIQAWPSPMTRRDLAEASEYSNSSSGFEKSLSALRTLGMITYPDRGSARAADLLFPEGVSGWLGDGSERIRH